MKDQERAFLILHGGFSNEVAFHLCHDVLHFDKVDVESHVVTTHLTLRLDEGTLHRLQEQSRRTGQSRSELARTLLDEGLRMEAHPGIVFRPGPAGRRPGLANGPDVWEIVRDFRELPNSGEERIRQTAELADLSPEQVRTAVRYYADYQDEIDAWILRADEASAEAEAAWRRQRELLDT